MPIDELYAAEVREQTGLFATWVPNAPLEIGHYGQVRGSLFLAMNQLEGLVTTTGPGTASYDFTIHATRKINTNAEALADAGVQTGKALLEVSFQREAGVTFSAVDTRVTRVQNIKALGEQLIGMGNNWDTDHAIVVEVITATRATIITSIQSGAEVKFAVEVGTPISANIMANLNAGTSLLMEKGVAAKVIGEGSLNPLFRLAFLKSRSFRGPKLSFRGPSGSEATGQQVPISDEHYLEVY